MKNFITLLFASTALFASSAFAATVVRSESMICTRDLNAWGHASHCSCPTEARYENRLGACVQGDAEAFTTVGQLSSEAAIGGETTGVVITNRAEGSYELVIDRTLQSQIDDLIAQGGRYRVKGEVIALEGVESGERQAVIVDTIEAVPANDYTTADQSTL